MLRRQKPFSLNRGGFPFQKLIRYSTKPKNRFVDSDDEENYERKKKAREGEDGYIHLHKSRGQHILTNPRVLDSIVRKAQIRPSDTVLEIGPGTGNLTLKLLEAAEKVVAVEIDKRMIEILCDRVSQQGLGDGLTVICQDALKTQFPKFDLCVANIPYGISSPLIAKLLFKVAPFRSATLLLQKEFARRLLAKPGDSAFNRLAVNVKLVATVEFLMDVSKKDFVPCPKVDSSVVTIRPKTQIPNVDLDEWWAFTRTCFSKKNKTLGAIFRQKKKVVELLKRSQMKGRFKDDEDHDDEEDDDGEEGDGCEDEHVDCPEMGLFKERILSILKEGGFQDKRPSKLSNEELLCLLSLFNQAGILFNEQGR